MFRKRLSRVYDDPQVVDHLNQRLIAMVEHYRQLVPPLKQQTWDQTDTLLITYGDSILAENHSPLQTFNTFARRYLQDQITFIHLLPFYPWSSDDGFAVKDFRQINETQGTWDDITALSRNFRLVFDAVINHVSESSIYMEGYRNGDPQYQNFFIALDPETDTSSVLRTRNLPLLHDYETHDSIKWLWTTFSRDQLDLNFRNPQVLLEIIDVLLGYLQRGAAMIRLDAIPYLWKELGTSCAHLPQTHELIKLIRDIYQATSPGAMLLTETNVPHHENIVYFGEGGDEAQMIYNFSLAPLIAHAILRQDSTVLSQWSSQIAFISESATYLNITATHDGIGMRPTEGLLTESERTWMCDLACERGGDITGKRNSDGTVSVYELNITYFDFLNDPASVESLDLQVARFMVAQAITLSFIGIPGIYIHSLLGSRNYTKGVKATGRARTINREQLTLPDLEASLQDPDSLRAKVYRTYQQLLTVRAQEPCFHPDASQTIINLGIRVFALQRQNQDRTLTAIHSLADQPLQVTLPQTGHDLLTDQPVGPEVHLAPYQTCWILH